MPLRMDHYHTVHEPDVVNFGTAETRKSTSPNCIHVASSLEADNPVDRLPTVSATQALDEVDDVARTHVSTGLASLDHALLGPLASEESDSDARGGVKRGQVTELWGPPGSGKTALGYVSLHHRFLTWPNVLTREILELNWQPRRCAVAVGWFG